MKISVAWLSDYLDTAPLLKDSKEVLSRLTLRGLEVESIQDLSKGLDHVVVAQILEKEKHPKADRLSVCKVNNGKEVLQIVCGAQNMKAGDKVALSQIGAHLPNGLKIEKGKIRDVESFGMLCSETELGIADTSEGILILSSDSVVGTPLEKHLGMEDLLFTLNVTPNRGDALSHRGVARELASILEQKLKTSVTAKTQPLTSKDSAKVKVSIEAGSACIQYHAKYISGVKVTQSPEWLQKRLKSIGLKPINNVVDITNFILFDQGQPLHAFDAKKLELPEIFVRYANKGEKLPLLDKTEVELEESDLVIADSKKAVALAGVMGGGNSEVDSATSDILLEAAQFDPAHVRRTARRHKKSTDSSYRFERQIDSAAVKEALERAAQLIVEICGGKIVGDSVSQISNEGRLTLKNVSERVLQLDLHKVAEFLGIKDLSLKTMQESLNLTGFQVKTPAAKFSDKVVDVVVPSYRPDVQIFEDLSEEVLRGIGFDQIPSVVPRLNDLPTTTGVVEEKLDKLSLLKTTLTQQGFSEVVNFAFTSTKKNADWSDAKQNSNAVVLENPLNEEFTTLKSSLLGGVVENFLHALHHQEREMRLFEVRSVYSKDSSKDTLVREELKCAGLLFGRAYEKSLLAQDRDADFFDLKAIFESVQDALNIRGVRLQPISSATEMAQFFHPFQSVQILAGNKTVGVLGRMHPKFEQEWKVKSAIFAFEFYLEPLLALSKLERKYSAISKFPHAWRDLSLIVPTGMASEKVLQSLVKHGKPLVDSAVVVDRYEGEKIPAGRYSLSVSMKIADANRTLQEQEVDASIQKILDGLKKELSVELRMQ